MVRVHVGVREGDDLREVTVYADSISQAVGKARDRFPGRAVRVVFPIDGEGFFGWRDTKQRTSTPSGSWPTGLRRQGLTVVKQPPSTIPGAEGGR
jgi:hypothetical protein